MEEIAKMHRGEISKKEDAMGFQLEHYAKEQMVVKLKRDVWGKIAVIIFYQCMNTSIVFALFRLLGNENEKRLVKTYTKIEQI